MAQDCCRYLFRKYSLTRYRFFGSAPQISKQPESLSEKKWLLIKEAQSHIAKRSSKSSNQKEVQITKSSLISQRRIPENFVQDVFIPHLEVKIYNGRLYPPWYLIDLIIAYSQMPVINATCAKSCADLVILRMVDFNGPEFSRLLFPLFRLTPTDTKLFALISVELEEHFFELSTLNLISIVRVYARLEKNEQQIEFLEQMVIPRLQADMTRYDTEELSAILVSLGAVPNMRTAADVPLLAAIIPQIEKRYDETPLLTSIINVNALCRLRIYHKRLIELLSKDLKNAFKIRNLPTKYIAMAVWTFARYGLLNTILPVFEPLIEDNLENFTVKEFARLCQALPETSDIPLLLALDITKRLPDVHVKEFSFYFIGLVCRGFLPTRDGDIPMRAYEQDDDRADNLDSSFHDLDTEIPDIKDPNLVDPEDVVRAVQDAHAEDNDAHAEDNNHEATAATTAEENPTDNESMETPTTTTTVPRETFLNECVEYLQTYQNDFNVEDIRKLTKILQFSVQQQYTYITTLFPTSWESIVHEITHHAQ